MESGKYTFDNLNSLGCVRKTFPGPNFSLVGIMIRSGANMPQKKKMTLLVNIFLYGNATEVPNPRGCYMKFHIAAPGDRNSVAFL